MNEKVCKRNRQQALQIPPHQGALHEGRWPEGSLAEGEAVREAAGPVAQLVGGPALQGLRPTSFHWACPAPSLHIKRETFCHLCQKCLFFVLYHYVLFCFLSPPKKKSKKK